MRFKFLWVTCFFVFAMLLILVGSFKGLSQSGNKGDAWKDPTTLRARVEKEKDKGNRKVVFAAPLLEYPDSISLETAVAETTIVVADVLDKQSRLIDPSTIATFYKLGVIERLSEPTSSPCCNPKDDDFPADLPAVGENEMYFVGIGGTIVLDEVEVTVKEDFDDLQPNRRYLFFLSATESGKFSVGKLGPRGVFTVAGNGHLDSRLKRFRLGRELESRAGNSLTRLKNEIVRLKNSRK
jgi:hypothetical protein